MGYLSKDQIVEAADLTTEDVLVPEWGGTVRVKAMTGAQRDRFEAAMRESSKDYRSKLAATTIVDEHGKRMFTDAEIAELGKKSSSALSRITVVALRLSRITKAETSELEKNSESGRSGSSRSS